MCGAVGKPMARCARGRPSPSANEDPRGPGAQRDAHLASVQHPRRDVLIHPEQVLWVPLRLHLNESFVVPSVGGTDTLVALLLRQKIDIRAARGEATQLPPRRPRPSDIGLV